MKRCGAAEAVALQHQLNPINSSAPSRSRRESLECFSSAGALLRGLAAESLTATHVQTTLPAKRQFVCYKCCGRVGDQSAGLCTMRMLASAWQDAKAVGWYV